MITSASTVCFKSDLDRTVSFLKGKNIGIELRLDMYNIVDKDIANWNNKLQDFEIVGVHLPFTDISLASKNNKIQRISKDIIIDYILKSIDLGADYVVLHLESSSRILNKSDFKNSLLEIIDTISNENINICIENAGCFTDLKVLADFVENINRHNVFMMIDVGHSFIRIKKSPISYFLRGIDRHLPLFNLKRDMPFSHYGSFQNFIDLNWPKIYGFHIHDNNGFAHARLGEGSINFNFLQKLNSKNFRGPLVIESKNLTRDSLSKDINFINENIINA